MASLAAINKTLIAQNKLLKTSIDGTATEKAKQAEERAERKTYDSEVLGTLKSIHSALGGGGGGGLAGADKKPDNRGTGDQYDLEFRGFIQNLEVQVQKIKL